MNVKTIAGWLLIALIVWMVIEDPSWASHSWHNTGHFFVSMAHGLSNFFASI